MNEPPIMCAHNFVEIEASHPHVDRVAMGGLIIVFLLLILAVQRFIANKRLANNRKNPQAP
jgi:hypothetical protein